MTFVLSWLGRLRVRYSMVMVAVLGLPIIVHLGLQWLLYARGFTALTADEFGRILFAAQWAEQPRWIWRGPWLPFHRYLFGLLFKLRWDLLYLPRAVTITIGLVSLPCMYLLTRGIFGQRRVAWISLLLLSVSPAHIWLSSTPLTEIYHTSLVLGCMTAFVYAINQRRQRYLYLSAALLALATGFRFEAWMVAVVYSLLLGGLLIGQRWRLMVPIFSPWALVGAAVMPWIFPCAWLIGGFLTTGQPLAFLSAIQDYKRTWYGDQQSWRNYLAPLLLIDRYALILLLPGVVISLIVHRRLNVIWYCIISIAPLLIFFGLHRGQLEPAGNYVRYLAPFVFMLYPLVAVALDTIVGALIKTRLYQTVVLAIVCVVIGTLQGGSSLRITNDSAGAGIAVGQHIRAVRTSNAISAQQSVLLELTYWQYMSIHIGANDLGTIVYDRPLDLAQRRSQSVFVTHPQSISACLATYNIGLLVVASPALRDVIEQELKLTPTTIVNDFRFYHVPAAPSSPETPSCPVALQTGSSR